MSSSVSRMVDQTLPRQGLKRRTEVHWARKLWHMGTVSFIFAFWILAPQSISFAGIVLAWVLFVPLDFLRQNSHAVNDWIVHAFRPIMRESERNRLAGTTYLLSGVLIVMFIFPRPVTSLTLLFLAFADPIASYFGIRFGRDKLFGHKSLQGAIAAYVVCTVASFFFVMSLRQPLDRAIVFSLIAGAVGALAELIPVGNLDDNLTLPVFSAIGLSGLFYFFGFWPNVV